MKKLSTSRRRFLQLLGGSAALSSVPFLLTACGGGGSSTSTSSSSSSSSSSSGGTSTSSSSSSGGTSTSSSSGATPTNVSGRVIVVGGGFAGASAAKYLRHWSNTVEVTLIEPNANYVSPILSNLVLNQSLNLSQITFNYNTLQQRYGVNVVQDYVVDIDSTNRTVNLGNGSSLAYDRLILAPGIEFDTVSGLDSTKIPHAWQAGLQTTLLRDQLAAMPNGGVFVMTIPSAPFRCPPGPYERACVVADYFKRQKPNSKVIVLDANADIIVEKETFKTAFEQTFAGIVDYQSNVTLTAVDSTQRIAFTNIGEFKADVLNIIPTQRAGDLIQRAGLANDATQRWAAVNPLSYESTLAEGIHIIGDSQATGQPKAGHIANAEAKVCADAVLRLLAGDSPYAAPMTNSACYSPITSNTASWLTAVFAYDAASGQMKLVPSSLDQSLSPTQGHYNRMFEWAENLFNDTFT